MRTTSTYTAQRKAQMRAWRFGDRQTFQEEGREIADARAAGLEAEYVEGQRFARMRAASANERDARRQRSRARLGIRSSADHRREFLADLVIEAGKTSRGAWTSAQLARWGVAWPPPKGWRRRLARRWAAS